MNVRARRGYTMLELLIALVLVSIFSSSLLFVSKMVLERSQDQAVQGGLQLVALREQQFAQKYGTFTGLASDLDSITGVTVTESATVDASVSIALGDKGSLGLAVKTASSCAYAVLSAPAAGGEFSTVTVTSAPCDGSAALPAGEVEADSGAPVSKIP